MKTLIITDLAHTDKLDRTAMAAVREIGRAHV